MVLSGGCDGPVRTESTCFLTDPIQPLPSGFGAVGLASSQKNLLLQLNCLRTEESGRESMWPD